MSRVERHLAGILCYKKHARDESEVVKRLKQRSGEELMSALIGDKMQEMKECPS